LLRNGFWHSNAPFARKRATGLNIPSAAAGVLACEKGHCCAMAFCIPSRLLRASGQRRDGMQKEGD